MEVTPEKCEVSGNIVLGRSWGTAPTRMEVLALAGASSLLFLITVVSFQSYRLTVLNFGDSSAYISIAAAIRRWDFSQLQIKQFWGYPYAMAATSLLTGISDQAALLLVAFVSSIVSVLVAYKLWGGWVAAFFAVLNFDWMQRSFLGGAEPLAVALIFGAFLAVRGERYVAASFMAALSTVVRPLGIFSLMAIGLVLLYRREYRKLLTSILISMSVAVLYSLPLARHFGDPLATVHSYQGGQYSLFGIPFVAIVRGTMLYSAPWTNLTVSFAWILLVIAGIFMMFYETHFREHARKNSVEVLFAVSYLLAVFCYNYPVFARSNFARFAIPALPLVFLALSRWIPRDRRVLWALGGVMPVLAAASAIGVHNVVHALMR